MKSKPLELKYGKLKTKRQQHLNTSGFKKQWLKGNFPIKRITWIFESALNTDQFVQIYFECSLTLYLLLPSSLSNPLFLYNAALLL